MIMTQFTWARRSLRHPLGVIGYECSSKGDKRFSAFTTRLQDGRTIEEWYQCDIKGYQPGGRNWRLGKGKPPLRSMTQEELYGAYKALWTVWANQNQELMVQLAIQCRQHGNVLTDCFASTPINQARALAEILNEWFPPREPTDVQDL
jgi:hypothetical protein